MRIVECRKTDLFKPWSPQWHFPFPLIRSPWQRGRYFTYLNSAVVETQSISRLCQFLFSLSLCHLGVYLCGVCYFVVRVAYVGVFLSESSPVEHISVQHFSSNLCPFDVFYHLYSVPIPTVCSLLYFFIYRWSKKVRNLCVPLVGAKIWIFNEKLRGFCHFIKVFYVLYW